METYIKEIETFGYKQMKKDGQFYYYFRSI
jgi:hypothetical protein